MSCAMKKLIYFFMILFSPELLFSQSADLKVEYEIVNDTAFNVNYKVKRTGNISWAFGSSSFVLNFNNAGLSNPRIIRRGYWDNSVNPQYTPMYSSLYGNSAVSLEIDYFGPNGGGAVLPDTFTSIGVIQFHILNSNMFHNMTWNINYSAIFDDYRVEWTSNINFINPINHLLDIKRIENKIPNGIELFQNYPNPFNISTKIYFRLSKQSDIDIYIYDFSGKIIKKFNFENLNDGNYEILLNFDGYSSGTYFLNFKSTYIQKTIKMILIK